MNDITKALEGAYRDRMMVSIPGSQSEVSCTSGRIDLLTHDEIIELKRYSDWRDGIGQLLSYHLDYPNHSMRLHVLMPVGTHESVLDKDVIPVCHKVKIRVTWEYEDEAIVHSAVIAGEMFSSVTHLNKRIRELRNEAKGLTLKKSTVEFLSEIINLCHWSETKFGGKVDQIKLDRRKDVDNMLMFSARSGSNEWQHLNFENYTEHAYKKALRCQLVGADEAKPTDATIYIGGHTKTTDHKSDVEVSVWVALVMLPDGRSEMLSGGSLEDDRFFDFQADISKRKLNHHAFAAAVALPTLIRMIWDLDEFVFGLGIERPEVHLSSSFLVEFLNEGAAGNVDKELQDLGLTSDWWDEVEPCVHQWAWVLDRGSAPMKQVLAEAASNCDRTLWYYMTYGHHEAEDEETWIESLHWEEYEVSRS